MGTCTASPDHKAFKCWKSGDGKIHQPTPGNKTGIPHRPKPVVSKPAKASKAYLTLEDAIAAAGRSIAGAVLAHVWMYPNAEGDEDAGVARYDLPCGKQFRPIHRAADGWHIGDPPGLWPLYGLPTLPSDGPIYVCEGEKCAGAACAIGLPATTSAHGSSSAGKTDWTLLAGRDVIILPDNDEPGRKYAPRR